MVVSMNKKNSPFSNVVVRQKSGGNLTYERPLFCENGKSLIVPSGGSCHLYSTSTGDRVKELFTCNHKIIHCQIHPQNSSEIICVTENGEVTVYNLQTHEIQSSITLSLTPEYLKDCKMRKFDTQTTDCVKYWDLNKNVNWHNEPLDDPKSRKFLSAHIEVFKKAQKTFIFTTWSLRDETQAHINVFTLHDGQPVPGINFYKTALKKCAKNFVIGTIKDSKVFVGMSTRAVTLAQFLDEKSFSKETIKIQRHLITAELELTCLIYHPTEASFATGDSLGRIHVWRNIMDSRPLKDEYHWHYLPVKDIAFSAVGNQLFSGGEETVVVKWALATQQKTFLPRLTSTIYHIQMAPDSSILAISTADNRILITSTQFNHISTIQHFSKWSGLGLYRSTCIFSTDPKTEAFVLNGRTGHVQFLSHRDGGRFLYSMDITNKNFITRDRGQTLNNTEVTHCKFNKSGQWMVTAELRKEEMIIECTLKFWEFNDIKQEFCLNTNVELPHENSEIYSLEISSDDLVATTGGDNKFKLWALFDAQQLNEIKKIWSVLIVGTYRLLPCDAVDFSKDSSLVAVGFGPVLTVWETNDCVLKCSLAAPLKRDDIKFLKFGNNELSHNIVTATNCNISSWNILSLCMIWTVPLKITLLVSDPFSRNMCAFSSRNSLFIFDPSSASPIFSCEDVSLTRVIAANFILRGGAGLSQLYFLNEDQELLCLENEEDVEAFTISEETAKKFTPFSAQIAEISRKDIFKKKKMPMVYNKLPSEYSSAILNSPCHTLPNPSLFCLDVLKGLALSVKRASEDKEEGEELKEDENFEKGKDKGDDLTQVEDFVSEKHLIKLKNSLFNEL